MYEKYLKRIMDCLLSGIALVCFSPVILIIALLVRFKLGTPIIYKQNRPGRNEKLFKLFKFRSMTNETDEDGNLLPDEKRLSRFGRILRATSLDELPELVNIFKGDMSIVGPRPLLIRYLPFYKEEERARHSVRPGLTGLAQINGRNNLDWNTRINFDIQYVKHITFVGDMKIILQTIGKVLKKSDIASGEELIMQDLDKEREWMVKMIDIQYIKMNTDDIEKYRNELILLMRMILADNISQNYPGDLAEQYVSKMSDYVSDGSAIIFGAVHEGILVGFSWAYEMTIFGERRMHVDMIGVDLKFRRSGIAKKLLEKQIKEAKKCNIYIIEAMTTKANKNSYNWFHSIGFDDERVKVKLELMK